MQLPGTVGKLDLFETLSLSSAVLTETDESNLGGGGGGCMLFGWGDDGGSMLFGGFGIEERLLERGGGNKLFKDIGSFLLFSILDGHLRF